MPDKKVIHNSQAIDLQGFRAENKCSILLAFGSLAAYDIWQLKSKTVQSIKTSTMSEKQAPKQTRFVPKPPNQPALNAEEITEIAKRIFTDLLSIVASEVPQCDYSVSFHLTPECSYAVIVPCFPNGKTIVIGPEEIKIGYYEGSKPE